MFSVLERTLSALPQPTHFTEAEYHALQNGSERKFEYLNGEIVAMVGAMVIHNRVAGNLFVTLYRLLEGSGCEPFNSDQRIYIPTAQAYLYPDASVVCGQADVMSQGGVEMILNPTLIIEVLSPSTAQYDRTVKLGLYQQLPSLRAYLMVEAESPFMEWYERTALGTWEHHQQRDLHASVPLPIGDLSLPLRDIYKSPTMNP